MTATAYNPSYRYGESNPMQLPYKSGVAVNVGDMVYQDDGDGYTVKPMMSLTWQTAISDPSAPTIADSGGAVSPGFGAGTYKAQITLVHKSGLESGPSALSSGVAITATHGITVSGVTLPADILSVRVYLTAAGGSTTTYLGELPAGATMTFTGPPQANATAPPAANGLSALALTQALGLQKFVGVAGQAFDGTNTSAYGINDGSLRVDTDGVYDFTCTSQTFNQGDLVTFAKDTGNNLAGQQVALAGTAAGLLPVAPGGAGGVANIRAVAFARVVKAYAAATTTVRVQLLADRYKSAVR